MGSGSVHFHWNLDRAPDGFIFGHMAENRKRPRDPNQLAKSIIDIATGSVPDRPPTPEEQGKDPAAAALGRKGGAARAAGLSAKRRSQIAKQASKARWTKS